jgi:16S rRNA (guanine527-N7)-methyltransferase
MRQAGIELELNNVQVHAGRVEAWQPSTLFDVVISRAFAEIADFITASRHLLKPGGIFAAMKGIDPHAELATLPQDIEVLNTIHLQVPGLDASRCLVLLRVGS